MSYGWWRWQLLALPAGGGHPGQEGRAPATLFLAVGATAAEETGAQELAAYLSQVTGATFTVTRGDRARPGEPASTWAPTLRGGTGGIDCTKLGPE